MSEHAYAAAPVTARHRASAASRAPRDSPWSALAAVAACVVGLAAVWCLAELVPAVHHKDAVVLYHFTTLSRPGLDSIGQFLLHLLEPGLFVLWGIALLAIAVARERPRVAVGVFLVLSLAPLTAELLKPLLAHPHDEIGYVSIAPASWPSGHSTAASSLAMCAVLVSPSRLRPLVAAIGLVFVLAVSLSLLVLAWHMPSDVIGGYLVAALWTSLAVFGVRLSERLRPSKSARAG